jgi:transposase-like protein
MTSYKKGVSSVQLANELNVTQNTAWSMIHRIRELVSGLHPEVETITADDYVFEVEPLAEFEMLKGVVEIDEVYIGGRNANKHKSKKLEGVQGASKKIKVPILGMYERSTGRIICIPVKDTTGPSLIAIIKKYVAEGTTIYTDDNTAYKDLTKDRYYKRKFTKHSAKEYVRGEVHTNNIERVWGLLRRSLMGAYHHMSEKHLHRYIAEFAFRIKNYELTQEQRFDLGLKQLKKVKTKKSIMAFEPNKHTYSGRGEDYPKEKQKKTLVRGKFSRAHNDFFEGHVREEMPSGDGLNEEVELGDEKDEDILYTGENNNGAYEMKLKDTEESVVKDYNKRWFRDNVGERYPFFDSELTTLKKGRGRPKGVKNKPKKDVDSNSNISVKKVTSSKKTSTIPAKRKRKGK